MKFISSNATLQNLNTDLLILPVVGKDLPLETKGIRTGKAGQEITFGNLNNLFSAELARSLKKASFKVEIAGASFLFCLPNPQVPAVLVYSVEEKFKGEHAVFNEHNFYRKLGSDITQTAKKLGAKNITISSQHLQLEKPSFLAALIEGLYLSNYCYTEYKSKKEPAQTETTIHLLGSPRLVNDSFINQTLAICEATSFARDLINMPPNSCTPVHMVAVAKQIAAKGKLKIEVFDEPKLKKMGAGSLLSVSQGSALPPYLIKLTYAPLKKNKNTKVISLVGKGVTFDTGGYSLKPSDGMIGMKGDMAGAACVLAVLKAIAHLKPNCEVRAYVPTVENMVSDKATRIGDVVTAMNGTTIEILNTDAEGRLILADALTLASNDKADITIDVATLTGACMVALGMQYAGLFSEDVKLSEQLMQSGRIAGERFWSLPLAPEYEDSIKSKVADLKNIGNGRWAGATIGALFLKHFVKDTRWAHLDIAGPADSECDRGYIKQGGVGFGVRTLVKFIQQVK